MRLFVSFILFFILSQPAAVQCLNGNRFMYATMSWSHSQTTTPTFVIFNVQQAWAYNEGYLEMNQTIASSSLFQLGYGDGTTSPSELNVVYITGNDTTNDYVLMSATWYHQYPATGVEYHVNFTNVCCLSMVVNLTTFASVPTSVPVLSALPVYGMVVNQETVILFPFNYVSTYSLVFVNGSQSGLSYDVPPGGNGYVSGRSLYWTPTVAGVYSMQMAAVHSQYPGWSMPFEFTINVTSTPVVGVGAPTNISTSELFDGYNISGGYDETIFVVVRSTLSIGYNGYLFTNVLPFNASISGCAEGSALTLSGRPYSLTHTTCTRTISWVPTSGAIDHEIALVTRSVDGSLSPVTMFRFRIARNKPIITSIAPNSGRTNGAFIVSIVGMWFGDATQLTATTIKFNGTVCGTPVFSSGNLLCLAPAGQGRLQPVTVTFFGRVSLPSFFNYNPPDISSVSPTTSMSTEGGTRITLAGSSFGIRYQVVTIGGAPQIPFTCTHTSCVVTLVPSAGGSRLPIFLTVENQTNAVVAVTFNFTRPSVSAVTFTQAPTVGGFILTIDGLNFGMNGSDARVDIGNSIGACTSVLHDTTTNAHRRLFCTAPAGVGTSKTLRVVLAGQASDVSPTFAYDAPVITDIGPPETLITGATFTITGFNFGPTSSTGSVSVSGSVTPTISWSDGSIVVLMPSLPLPSGSNYITVTTSGQSSTPTTFTTYVLPPSSSASPLLPSSSAHEALLSSSAPPVVLVSSSADEIVSSSSSDVLVSSSASNVVLVSSSAIQSSTASVVLMSSSSSGSSMLLSSSSSVDVLLSSSSLNDIIDSSSADSELLVSSSSSTGGDESSTADEALSSSTGLNETLITDDGSEPLNHAEIAGIVIGAFVGTIVVVAFASVTIAAFQPAAAYGFMPVGSRISPSSDVIGDRDLY